MCGFNGKKNTIEQAAMDGTQRKTLVVSHDGFPNLASLTTNIQGTVLSRDKGTLNIM